MNKIEDKIKEIKLEIQNEECVKEYYRLKKIIKEDKTLCSLDIDIKRLQKEMCENRKNDELFSSLKKEYDLKVKEFETNPLIINYRISEEEVRNYLFQIKDILEQKWLSL